MTETNLNDASVLESDTSEAVADEKALWPSPGRFLKDLREELGLSYAQVSEALYITVHYVKALENDDYSKLPGHTFIKGYYKSYAEFLCTDTEKVMNYYFNFIENLNNENMQEAQLADAKIQSNKKLWLGLVVFIAVLAAVLLIMNDANAQLMPAMLELVNE